MVSLFMLYFCIMVCSFFLTMSRFLNCLMMLEKFKVLILLFSLMMSQLSSHMIFIVLMVVSTVEVIIGLVVLTRVWECSNSLELVFF